MALRPRTGMFTESNNVITDPEQIRNILQPTQFAIGRVLMTKIFLKMF